jgi:hypothetical protein
MQLRTVLQRLGETLGAERCVPQGGIAWLPADISWYIFDRRFPAFGTEPQIEK